jgi:hypothetical protein
MAPAVHEQKAHDAPVSPRCRPVPLEAQATIEEVEMLLMEMAKFDKRLALRSIPLAALQMTVDSLLQQGLSVDRTKLLVDRYCKRATDGRIDYSMLYNLWMSQYDGSSCGDALSDVGGFAFAADESVWKHDMPPGAGEAVTTPEVQMLYAQWGLGQLDAHALIDRLGMLPEIREIGGVSPSCERRILDHQFDHDLSYSDFLRALRNTGKPEFVPDRLDLASMKKSKKKIFGNAPGQESQSKELLFPAHQTPEDLANQPVLSVVSGKEMRPSEAKRVLTASDGVATALTASEHIVDGKSVKWTPTRGEEVIGADAAAQAVGEAGEQVMKTHERKHYVAKDDVGEIFASPAGVIETFKPQKKPISSSNQGNMGAVLFGGGTSVSQSLFHGDPGNRAGVLAGGERPIGKRTFYGDQANLPGGVSNHDIAVGPRVNEPTNATTQELLWGNMIRRAR